MLESLLNAFRVNGMGDLEFIIVNSKLPHSQENIHELQRRVTFNVYQETEEEKVWSVLEGRKDDMFVYDRCGRLAFYVPFPLSNLLEYTYVIQAVATTYIHSPCGDTCEKNDTLGIDATSPDDLESVAYTTEDYIYSTVSYEAVNESSNNLLNAVNSDNYSDSFNGSDSFYNSNNSLPSYNDTESISNYSSEAGISFINSIFSALSNNYSSGASNEIPNIASVNDKSNNTENVNSENDLLHKETIHTHHHKDAKPNNKQKSDKCAEIDYSLCESWSKKRLLRSQRCCSFDSYQHSLPHDRSCHGFGKKKCKKILPLLKCCLKTFYQESSTAIPDAEQTTAVSDVVCCRNDKGTFCRVSETGHCQEDEFVHEGPFESKP